MAQEKREIQGQKDKETLKEKDKYKASNISEGTFPEDTSPEPPQKRDQDLSDSNGKRKK